MKKILILFLFSLALQASAQTPGFKGDWNKDFYLKYVDAVTSEKSGAREKAMSLYKSLLQVYPESDILKEDIVRTAVFLDKPELAETEAEALKEINTAAAASTYATYSWARGHISEADIYYQKALELNPEDLSSLNKYVVMLTHSDYKKAVAFLEKYALASPAIAHVAYAEIGNIYVTKKDLDKALEYYDKAKAAYPAFDKPYLLKAEIYQSRKDMTAALKEYEELAQTGRTTPEIYNKMALLSIINKQDDKAVEYFLAAKNLKNSDPAANLYLAEISARDKKYESAVVFLQDAADYKTNPARMLSAALYSERAGQSRQTHDILKEAALTFPDNVEIKYFYALSLQAQKEYQQAISVLSGVLKTNPAFDRGRLMYGYMLFKNNEPAKARKEFEKLTDKFPEEAELFNTLGYILAEQNKDLDRAESYVKKSLELSPATPAYLDSLGWVYYKKKDYNKALDFLSQAYKSLPQDPEVNLHLALTYYKLKDKEKALLHLQKADEKSLEKYKKQIEKLP